MELPTKIGRYEIQRELGRGMMGVVYEAHDPALGRKIALKVIRLGFAASSEEQRSFEQRFLVEARVAARLSHPGIVVVHDVGQDPERATPYIALEFLVGRTLGEMVTEGRPIEWREALRITKRVAEALHHAHTQGVIHRDIKPANIMILGSGQPKIMDFGIAKIESGQLTSAGQFFGTPLYMSPEQALGRPLDARSDLFSLGTLAYYMVTGQQAFGAAAVPRIITRVIQEDPPPPTRLVRAVPADLDYYLARALAKDPVDRYPDGTTMAEDAEDILAARPPRHRRGWVEPRRADGTLVSSAGPTPTPATPAPPPAAASPRPPAAPGRRERARRIPEDRRTSPWVAAAVGALLVGTGVAGGLLVARDPREAERPVDPPAPASTIGTIPDSTLAADPSGNDPADTAPEVGAPATTPPDTTPPRPRAAAPRPAAGRKDATTAKDPARLAVAFEHTLKDGRLRIWVDDAQVLNQPLGSRVTTKMVTFEFRKGSVSETLDLTPGTHEVKVQVTWDGGVKTKHIAGHFAAGITRRLSAKLGVGVRGFVQKDLKLEWE